MFLTVKDVAARLNISVSCIYQLVESGKLAHHRIGLGRGAIRFSDGDIDEYLAGVRQQVRNHAAATPLGRKLKHIKL